MIAVLFFCILAAPVAAILVALAYAGLALVAAIDIGIRTVDRFVKHRRTMRIAHRK